MIDREQGAATLAHFDRFCTTLTVEEGTPMRLQGFQRELLADYFAGSRETLVILSKKNGKTTLLSALSLFHLILQRQAECVIGATSREQAGILYEQAAGFVQRNPALQDRVSVKRGYRELRSTRDRGRIRVLAADVDTADGVIPTLALVDELHRAKSLSLYGVFRDGLGPRGGQMITITTAGATEASPLGRMRSAALRLPLERQGRYVHALSEDGQFALHEWSLDRDDDLYDLELVKEVNPAPWQTLDELKLRRDSPSTTPWQWARFACGIWVDMEAYWMTADDWQMGETTERLEDDDRITLGFDGSRFNDATALVACRLEDGLLELLGVWEKPEGRDEWEVPAGEVEAVLDDAMERFRVLRVYADPPLWQTEVDAWARTYSEATVMRYHTNRSRFMLALERFRTDVAAGQVPHSYSPVLDQHILNAQTRQAARGYWLAKPSDDGKIDAAIAAVLAYEARCEVVAEEADRGEFAFF